MATKSPGVYLTEYDNTQYTNPKTISGTTVAVVGFAQKGVVGVPTEITSYKNFTSTFGQPIDGYYSALAVKNILTAGGKVLFTRVADSSASLSNIVVKNGIAATNGYTSFDRKTDILVGTSGYKNQSLYGVNVTNADNESKDLIVRSPLAGKLSQSSILTQLNAGLAASVPTYEVIKTNATPEGIYSFEVARNGKVLDESDAEVSEANQGFFIETTVNETIDTLAAAFEKALNNGPNGICILTVSTTKDGASAYFDENTVTFANLSGTKKFNIYNGASTKQISVSITAGSTLSTIVSAIDAATSVYGIRAIVLPGDSSANTAPRILFVNKSGDYDDFYIQSIGNTVTEDTELFLLGASTVTELPEASAANAGTINLYNGDDETTYTKGKYYISTLSDDTYSWIEADSAYDNLTLADTTDNGFYVTSIYSRAGISTTSSVANTRRNITVSVNETTNSLVFAGTVEGSGETVEVVAAPYGTFVFGDDGLNLGTIVGSVEGTDYLSGITITRDSTTKKITFTSDNVDAPILADSTNEKLLSLLTIEKNVDDTSSTGSTSVNGNYEISDSERDMVVISAKEVGAGTAGLISVEFYTSTSPLTGATKHDIYIRVDGVLMETYEDVSYSYSDVENRFDTIINQAEDNGGSAYVTMTVVKNLLSEDDVTINDGTYTIGTAQSDDSIARASDIDEKSYTLYDYTVGDNGVPADGGDELFETVMETDTSALADKDLFSFHVLIAPDNISETVQTAEIALCESRGDAITIIDPPVGLDRDAVIDWHNGRGYGRSTGVNSTYAATYWPWCKVYDSTQKKYAWVMPSVVMAAKYVTVDRTAGCWFPPAGETNGVMSVVDIEQYPNVVDRDKLYVEYNRINPFMRLGDGSIICYGEKTLQRINSVLTKIHTRRMLIQIKKEAKEALRGYIFQLTTSENLQKISADMTAIMEKYKAGGGLASYTVVCDDTNNTTETMQQDIIYVDIACVPNGAIEQIEIGLTLNKSEETVSVA